MEPEFEFDKTRDAIGAKKLSDDERKAMLNKFKGAGGEVLGEKELRRDDGSGKADDDSPRRSRKAGGGGGGVDEIKTPSQMYRERKRAEAEKKAALRGEWQKTREKLGGKSARFFIRLRCFLQGLTPFSDAEVKPKFMNFMALSVKGALVDFNLIGNEFFLKDRAIAKKIVQTLDAKNPMLMEVFEYVHTLYKQDDFQKLIDNVQSNPNSNTPLASVEEPLKKFFLQLYYVYPYQETLKRAIQFAFEIYKRESSNESDITRVDTFRKKVLKDIKNVFQVAFPRLFQLLCRSDNMDYPPFSPILEKAIGVNPADRLGKRKKGDASKLGKTSGEEEDDDNEEVAAEEGANEANETNASAEAETSAPKKEEKKEEPSNPILATKEYKYGYSLMNMYRLPALRKKVDPQNHFADLPFRDKVFIAYMFFQEYDFEYSFVQTTNKIKLNVDYAEGVKTDYKQVMADLYNESRDIVRAFEKYYQAIKELHGLKSTKSGNYIEQSKMETKQEKNVDVEARNTRGLIRTYMSNVAKNLALLISDMKGEKKIVGNMDEDVRFDSALEGKKRLNGKLVKQCIMEAYCYTLALKERLESGDLYGGIIQMTDEEMVTSFGSTFEEKKSQGASDEELLPSS